MLRLHYTETGETASCPLLRRQARRPESSRVGPVCRPSRANGWFGEGRTWLCDSESSAITRRFSAPEGTKIFGVHGGSIGRASDNDWILPDPERYVSGHHATIEYRDGGYWLTDTSSNGTYVNEETAPISDVGPQALKDGDRLRIGDYEVIVSIDAANDFPPEKSAIIAYDGLGSSAARQSTEDDLGESLNLDALLAPESSGSRPVTPVNAYGQAVDLPRISSTDAPLTPKPRVPVRPKAAAAKSGEQAVESLHAAAHRPLSQPSQELRRSRMRTCARPPNLRPAAERRPCRPCVVAPASTRPGNSRRDPAAGVAARRPDPARGRDGP